MSRILYCDYLFQSGNICVDKQLLGVLCKNNQVTALTSPERIDILPNLTIIDKPFYRYKKGKIKNMFRIIKIMINSAKYANKLKPDLVFVSVYETRLFWIARFLINKKIPIAILENINVDMLDKRLYYKLYKMYCNKVYHYVYEDYIGDYLTNVIGVKKSLVFTVAHPYYMLADSKIDLDLQYIAYDAIAISGSNDENFIKEMVELETKTSFLKNNNIRLLVKSKTLSFNDGFLIVEDAHFSNEEYEYYYDKCKLVLAPFPIEYRYRMSGCLVDSFSHNKKVVATKFMLAVEYEKKYNGIVKTIKTADELFESLLCEESINFDSLGRFKNDHSLQKIESQLNHSFKSIIKN